MKFQISLLVFWIIKAEWIVDGNNYEDTATIGPVKFTFWHTWAEQLGNSHLAAMTAELVRDSLGKMRTSQQLGRKYEKNVMFKVGSVASSLQLLFDKLLHIYRDVSNLTEFRHKDWTHISSINKTVQALSMAQSLLHRIRLEKKLFLEILKDDQESKAEEQTKAQKKYGKHIPPDIPVISKPKGGMFVPRRANDWFQEDFEFKFELPASLPKTRRMQTKNNETMKEMRKKLERKPEELAPKPGENLPTKRTINQKLPANPYSDLAHLLSASGAGTRSRSSLLSLLPSNMKREMKASPSDSRIDRVLDRKQEKNKAKVIISRRENNEANFHQSSSNRRFNDKNVKISQKAIWRPALPFENHQHSYSNEENLHKSIGLTIDESPITVVKQTLNHRQVYDKNKATELESRRSQNDKVKTQKVLWRPGDNQQPWHKYQETDHKQISNVQADQPTNLHHLNIEGATKTQRSKTQRVKWRPLYNSRRVYDKNGDAIGQQPSSN